MSFTFKTALFSVILILFLPGLYLGYRYYNRPKPMPIPPRAEINITIIPGWNLRQIANSWIEKGIIKTPEQLYDLVGEPAKNYRAVGKSAPVLSWVSTSTLEFLFANKIYFV